MKACEEELTSRNPGFTLGDRLSILVVPNPPLPRILCRRYRGRSQRYMVLLGDLQRGEQAEGEGWRVHLTSISSEHITLFLPLFRRPATLPIFPLPIFP